MENMVTKMILEYVETNGLDFEKDYPQITADIKNMVSNSVYDILKSGVTKNLVLQK